jgi:hypothetical protein
MLARFPSLQELFGTARAAFWRFPETVFFGLACGALGVTLLGRTLPSSDHLAELLTSLALGISLSFAVSATAEARDLPRRTRTAGMLAVVLLIGAHFSSSWFQSTELFALRYALFALGAHLVVAFLPYLGRATDDAFWDYNQQLLLGFATSVVYSGFLFAGLAIAMGTAQALFSWNIPFEAYARLWLVIAFVFNTWVFCGSVPHPLPQGPGVSAYPRPVQILTQYILIPLVTLYLLILYGYTVQIAIQRTWPRGTVGWLVSGFSVLGILALLLIHPVRDASRNRWVRVYAQRFYLSLFPLIVLLVLATWRRISEYGLTEKRYLLLALGLWIAGVAASFLSAPRRDIRMVPVSLCVVILLASFGPWGAASVSRWDQLRRLRNNLERRDLYRNGRVRPATSPVGFAERRTISAGLDYLNQVHRGAGLRSWFPDSVFSSAKKGDREDGDGTSRRMMAALGLEYVPRWESVPTDRFAFWSQTVNDTLDPVPALGYQAMARIQLYHYGDPETRRIVVLGGRTISIVLRDSGRVLEVSDGRSTVAMPMAELVSRLRARQSGSGQSIPQSAMTLEASADGLGVKMVLQNLGGRVTEPTGLAGRTTVAVEQLDGYVLLRTEASHLEAPAP